MSAVNPRSITDQVLALIEDTNADQHWSELASRAFVDTIAVLLAGAVDPSVRAVAGSIGESGGNARSLATSTAMSPRSAALIDGTSAHALDYDDVDDAVIAHPSAVLVPALLAASSTQEVTGAELIPAFRTGVRVGRAIAAAIDIRSHYELGWHSTATIGTIGATAAVAQLLRLTMDEARHAIGIAGSLAGGSRRAFGTMTKPLHAGIAAGNGILAAQLAVNGLTSDPDLIGSPLGFLELHSEHPGMAAPSLAAAPIDEPALNVKLFPCCYYTHSAAEAALSLSTDSVGHNGIEQVTVTVQPGGLAPLLHRRPTDGSQAKISMESVGAAALLDGRIDLNTFSDDRVACIDVQQLLTRVEVAEAPAPPIGPSSPRGPFAAVVIRRGDGTTAQKRVDRPAGHASRPVSDEQLHRKFDDCIAFADPSARHHVFQDLRNLRNQSSIRELIDQICQLSQSRFGGKI